jgi:hypothetical protein
MRILLDDNQEIGTEENVYMLMCDQHDAMLNCDVRCLLYLQFRNVGTGVTNQNYTNEIE